MEREWVWVIAEERRSRKDFTIVDDKEQETLSREADTRGLERGPVQNANERLLYVASLTITAISQHFTSCIVCS